MAGGDCGGAASGFAIFVRGAEYELCVAGSGVGEGLGAGAGTSGGDFCGGGGVVVLADALGVEEGVSGGGVEWRRKKKLAQRRRGR